MNMKKILLIALLALSFFSSCRAQTVFTFECFCGYLTLADGNCDVCGPTLQSRMFTGIIIRRNGVPHKWIETPYTVRFNGQVARFQELVYPNPEVINIDRSQTPYGTLDSFKLAIQCPCLAGGGGRDTIVIDSSGAVCEALYFFANDTAAIASPTTDQYDYYLMAPENYYGMPAGLVKLAWETTLPDSASTPGCGGGGSGSGTVTSFAFTDGGGFTGTVLNPTTTPTLSLVLQDAAADGATKGQATFTAADFNSAAGLISLDYTNGQKANGTQPGFLSSADWSTFNGKLTANAPITGATKTKITYDANGLVTAGANATTSDIAEGSNLYYTDERNDDRTAALIQNSTGISWTYNDGAGTLTPTLTDNSATNEIQTLSASGSGPFAVNLSSGGGSVSLIEGTGIDMERSGNSITINTTSSGGSDFLGTGFTGGGGTGSIPGETTILLGYGVRIDGNFGTYPSTIEQLPGSTDITGWEDFFGFKGDASHFFGQVRENTSDWAIGAWVSDDGINGIESKFGESEWYAKNVYSSQNAELRLNTANLTLKRTGLSSKVGQIKFDGNGVTYSMANGSTPITKIDHKTTGVYEFTDSRDTPLGITYAADYSTDIKTNDRSIPDVGTVLQLIDENPPAASGIEVEPRLEGTGTPSNPLDIAQNGATTGQVLQWDGSAWTPASQLPYKSYVALLTQTVGDAPVATVVYNTLSGTPTWDYQENGDYRVNLTGEFTTGKTIAFIGGSNYSIIGYTFTVQYLSEDTIRILSIGDSLMTDTAFEIRVYP